MQCELIKTGKVVFSGQTLGFNVLWCSVDETAENESDFELSCHNQRELSESISPFEVYLHWSALNQPRYCSDSFRSLQTFLQRGFKPVSRWGPAAVGHVDPNNFKLLEYRQYMYMRESAVTRQSLAYNRPWDIISAPRPINVQYFCTTVAKWGICYTRSVSVNDKQSVHNSRQDQVYCYIWLYGWSICYMAGI